MSTSRPLGDEIPPNGQTVIESRVIGIGRHNFIRHILVNFRRIFRATKVLISADLSVGENLTARATQMKKQPNRTVLND